MYGFSPAVFLNMANENRLKTVCIINQSGWQSN